MIDKTLSPDATERQYYDLIRRAAILQREFLGANETERFKNNGGEVLYSLDTDVFASYANSVLKGPLTGVNRNGYGQLLPRRYDVRSLSRIEDEELRRKVKSTRFWENHDAVIIARRLAEVALKKGKFKSGERELFLQLDEHFEETSRMLASVKQKVNRADLGQADKQRATLKIKVLKAFQALSVSLSGLTKKDRPSVSRFLGFLIGQIMHREMLSETGPLFEARNYQDLRIWGDRGTGRMPLSDFVTMHRSSFYSFSESRHDTARSVLRLLWNDLLKDAKTEEKQREPDVEALTRLTILNQHLFRSYCDWGEDPVRVVFLTGDVGLLEACYRAPDVLNRRLRHYIQQAFTDAGPSELYRKQTELERYFGFDRSNSTRKWFDRFSLHYVRHIRAFSREVLFDETDKPEEHLGDIFDGLFAGEARKLMRSRRSLEKLIEFPEKKERPEDIEKDFGSALEKWNSLVKRAVGKKGLDNWVRESGDNEIIKKVTTDIVTGGQSDADWKVVTDWLFEHVSREKDDAMISLSGLGAETLGQVEVTYPPDLYFDTLEKCRDIFRNLAMTPGYLKSRELIRDFEEINEDCYPKKNIASRGDTNGKQDRRWEHHLRFLVLGAVFASAQKWSVAEEHARRAVDIIKRADKLGDDAKIITKDETSNPSGREAYFLRTVCARIRAQNETELTIAEEHLESARNAFKKDLSVAPKHPLKGLIELRFQNEQLSLALAQYYQARSDLEPEQEKEVAEEHEGEGTAERPETKEPPENSTQARIETISAELARTWNKLEGNQELEEFLDPKAGFPKKLTGMYIALNILQLATIATYWKKMPDDGDEILKAWKTGLPDAAPKKECTEKAFEFLAEVNRDYDDLRSTKMAKAYEISGTIILKKRLPAEYNDKETIERLFQELGSEVRAEYDKWRVKYLKKFIIDRLGSRSD